MAIQEALDDMQAGDVGEPADKVVERIRREIQESQKS